MKDRDTLPHNPDILDSEEARIVKNYFINHEWIERSCHNCGSPFLAKLRNKTTTCGRSDCSNLDFLDRPKRKQFLGVVEFAQRFEIFFSNLGYVKSDPTSIINETGSTLFAGTAGQIFDRTIFNEVGYDTQSRFVAQPVIRLQSRSLVGKTEAYSTSFVNIALEQLNPSTEDHVKHIDDWLNFSSKMGLFMGEMTVRIVKDSPDWNGHKFDALTAKMYYGGLEVGVANLFIGIPQTSREPLRMSDISFGLERLVWVANKSRSYFDAIGPLRYSIKDRQKFMDSYRTAVLMSLAGVIPGYKDRSSKLRAQIKDISDPNEEIDKDLVIYYANWWKRFSTYPVPVEGVLQVIIKERNRNINLDIKNSLGAPDSILLDISPSEYIDEIIKFGIPFNKIREFLEMYAKSDE